MSYFVRTLVFCLIVGTVVGTLWWFRGDSKPKPEDLIKDRFISYVTSLSPVRRLQLAQLQQMEIFERKSGAKLMGTSLDLPDVVIRASVPVEYTYYVDLSEKWTLQIQNGEILVMAPNLKPNTPASNVSEMTFEIKKGSLFRNEKDVAKGLQSDMMGLLHQRAVQHTDLVREVARKELESVARAWLKLENRKENVRVYFSSENISEQDIH